MSDPLDLDALEVTAQKATKGPWFSRRSLAPRLTLPYVVYSNKAKANVAEGYEGGKADVQHIAAFDPHTVLALIAELRTARSALADAWDEGCKFGYDYGRIEGRDDCAYAVPTANPYIDRNGGTT